MKVKVNSRRNMIIMKSADLFLEKGYAASSMREIAQLVGLEPSSIYSHIKSKKDILAIICFHHATFYLESIDNILKESDNPVEQLQALLYLHIDRAIEDRSSAIVFSDEWKNLEEIKLTEFLTLRKLYEQKIISILVRGMERGLFRKVDSEVAMRTLLSAIRWLHYGYKYTKGSKERLETDISTLIMRGIIKS